MRLDEIECFVTIAEELHFGRAAARLHRSPSAVTRSLQELERRLGVTLVLRSSRGVHLTSAGRRLLGPARMLLTSYLGLVGEPDDGEVVEEAPAVSVGVSVSAAPQLVDSLLRVLRSEFSEVGVVTSFGTTRQLAHRIRDGALDLALAHDSTSVSDLRFAALHEYDWMVAARADEPLAGRGGLTLDDLRGRTYIPPFHAERFLQPPWPTILAAEPGAMLWSSRDAAVTANKVLMHGGFVPVVDPGLGGWASLFDADMFHVLPADVPWPVVRFGVVYGDPAVIDRSPSLGALVRGEGRRLREEAGRCA